MTMTLLSMMKNLLNAKREAFAISMRYVYDAYIEAQGKLIFSSRNNLFKDSTNPEEILSSAKSSVLKLSVISAKIDNGHCYIRLDI